MNERILYTWDPQLYFLPKQFLPQIFISLKNPLTLSPFESLNLGHNGKHITTTHFIFEPANQNTKSCSAIGLWHSKLPQK
jgi:hypothetical protein